MFKKISIYVTALWLGFISCAFADDYPNSRPINLIVPFSKDGPTDLLARHLAKQLEHELDTIVKIENIRGLSGSLGLKHLQEQEANGLWLAIAGNSSLLGYSALTNNQDYSPITDFTHIAPIAIVPHVLLAKPNIGVQSFNHFVDFAKNPANTKYYFSSSGLGQDTYCLPSCKN